MPVQALLLNRLFLQLQLVEFRISSPAREQFVVRAGLGAACPGGAEFGGGARGHDDGGMRPETARTAAPPHDALFTPTPST